MSTKSMKPRYEHRIELLILTSQNVCCEMFYASFIGFVVCGYACLIISNKCVKLLQIAYDSTSAVGFNYFNNSRGDLIIVEVI